MFKLYFSPGACSLAPHIVLREADLPFELVRVDLRAKTYPGGDYWKINPKGGVPALGLSNGEILTEDAVILQYLADQKPEMNLAPKAGTMERYRLQEWLNFIATELHKGFGPLWKPNTPEDFKPIVIANLSQRFDLVNHQLEKNDFLMGKSYTIADAYLFTVTRWHQPLKIDLSPWPALGRFMERIKARPATADAFKAEGLK
ncbi:MAG: glutathione transferase GstA [Deltaproteobacteria bacterium]|nr:glutathione transferase GstA [Deltaproteobacteria bacterium]